MRAHAAPVEGGKVHPNDLGAEVSVLDGSVTTGATPDLRRTEVSDDGQKGMGAPVRAPE